jgi:hypothetical protein
LRDYIQNVKEVWIHRPPELNEYDKRLITSYNQANNIKSIQHFALENQIYEHYPHIKEEAIREKAEFVIKSLGQLKRILEIVPEQKRRNVFYGYTFEGWPEIKVLGPTQEYYQTLFPAHITLEEIIVLESADYINESLISLRNRKLKLINNQVNPCSLLKDEKTARLTPTNKASIVFAIDNKDQRYLFSGDAGIESFKMIPDYQSELKDLYWLKIPHHGSDNNLSKDLIAIMNPMYADNTGDRHQDQIVLDCISQNVRSERPARSTKTAGHLEFIIE